MYHQQSDFKICLKLKTYGVTLPPPTPAPNFDVALCVYMFGLMPVHMATAEKGGGGGGFVSKLL